MIDQTRRGSDFGSALGALATGVVPIDSVAFQLFLNIGQFISAETVHNVRYNSLTLVFWTLVYKMFRSRAI